MNNLHRELAPISDAAWADIEPEARRTFEQNVAAPPGGGRRRARRPRARQREHRPPERRSTRPRTASSPSCATRKPLVRLRVPFTVTGMTWTTSSAARKTPTGSRSRTPPRRSPSPRTGRSSKGTRPPGSPGSGRARPTRRSRCPPRPATTRTWSARRSSALRLAGVGRPVLAAAVGRRLHDGQRDLRSRLSDPRAPGPGDRRRDHLGARHRRGVRCSPAAAATSSCGWARTCRSATCPTTRTAVQLYFQESLTFLVYTAEASVSLAVAPAAITR